DRLRAFGFRFSDFDFSPEGTVRRLWIHIVLPLAVAAVPVLAAALLFAAIPPDARRDYLNRVAESPIDWIIIALGFTLFAAQVFLAWRGVVGGGGVGALTRRPV